MKLSGPDPLKRLLSLAFGASRAPAGAFRISIALFYGVVCHSVFIAAVLAMIVAMFFGMSESLGTIPQPWSIIVNIFLILQFPIAHSLLLSKRGTFVLAKLAPQRLRIPARLLTVLISILFRQGKYLSDARNLWFLEGLCLNSWSKGQNYARANQRLGRQVRCCNGAESHLKCGMAKRCRTGLIQES